MWTKWLMVLVLAISGCARISGLQNDLNIGYSYSQPGDVSVTTIPASLAYYIKIPASQPNVDYYYVLSGGADSQHNHYTSQYHVQDVTSAYRQPQPSYTQDVGYVRQQQPEPARGNNFRPYTPSDQQQEGFSSQALPSLKVANEFAQSGNGYQVNPRSLSNHQTVRTESPFRPQLGRTVPRTETHQDYHSDHSAPSQNLVPPPYNQREASQIEQKGFGGSSTKQQYTAPAMASLPTSYNAQLPFPLGTVPIKFKPFPLKTHLRTNGILPPITSYQARESYKK